MSTIILTTGAPGTGKTYSRVKWLVTDFLVNSRGLYITNFPLNIDLISADVSSRLDCDPEDIRCRIVVVPNDELHSWRDLMLPDAKQKLSQLDKNKKFPPGEFFESYDLSNAHIAIDEFHRYCSKKSPALWLKMWTEWLAEVRKLGCTFEAITQDLSLIPQEFVGKVGGRIDLLPHASERDPFFKIPLADWYEVRAAYFGVVEQKICQTEYNKGTSFTGRVKWKKVHSENFVISSDYWKYYESYQQSEKGGASGTPISPHQQYGRKVIFWFFRRNFFRLFIKFLLAGIFVWLCFFGGLNTIIRGFTGMMASMSASNSAKSSSAPARRRAEEVSFSSPGATGGSFQVKNGTFASSAPEQSTASVSVPVAVPVMDYKPALFFDGFCWLRNGVKIGVGYKFTEGIYDGKTVKKIDSAERFYLLDDGVVVHMF